VSVEPNVSEPPRVTIVVPIYGDWDSLHDCLRSLIEHAPAETYDVLLVNDCGPEANEMEAGIRGLIYGRPQFRYERNPHNLGFGMTCNRAVTELDTSTNDILLLNSDTVLTAGALDELRAVLHVSPQHGTVCPRSNDATIASIPFFQRDKEAERDTSRAEEVFAGISQHLPRFYVSPVSVGFCMLIRRTLIEQFGLFDEVFGRGYNEENDFCLRINEAGYSSLIANHALVRHVGSTSFGSAQRTELEAKNSRILHARYPFYPRAVATFVRHGYGAIDRFADLLVDAPTHRKSKVLVDLAGPHSLLDHLHETGSVLSAIRALSAEAEVTIVAAEGTPTMTGADGRQLLFVERESIDEVFDLAVVMAPITSLDYLIMLNRYALQWVLAAPEPVDTRSTKALAEGAHTSLAYGLAMEYADHLIVGDAKALDDAEVLYGWSEGTPHTMIEMLSGDGAAHAWNRLIADTRQPSRDLVRLTQRDRAMRPLALAVDSANETLAENTHSLRAIQRSTAYAVARGASSLASTLRRRSR
jgi:GT2 family glycosyltransferase